jgi:hypothetical protein
MRGMTAITAFFSRGCLLKHRIAPESLNTGFNLDGVIKLASRFVLLSSARVYPCSDGDSLVR